MIDQPPRPALTGRPLQPTTQLPDVNVAPSITITGIGDHHRKEWPITFTGICMDLTYLSDTVLLLRFFEAGGQIRRAASVIKKRTGSHENTIREFCIDSRGVRVGERLIEFRGVLTGVPTYEGQSAALMRGRGSDR